MLVASIPPKFPIPFAQNAGPSYIRPIPTASQIGVQDGAASLNDGFVPLNMTPIAGGGVPPFGKDMNGILKQISQWAQWQGAGAPVGYDPTFSTNIGGYPQGAVIASSVLGSFWLSQVDNNTSNPNTGGANWIGFTPVDLYALDTGTANAGVASLVPPPFNLAALTGRAVRIKKVTSVNTTAYTLNLNGFGPIAVVHADGTALTANELPSGGVYTAVYDGTNYQLQSLGVAGGVSPYQLQAQATNFGVDGGTPNVMTISLSPAPLSLASINGTAIRIKKSAAPNTGPVTLDVNGFGGQPVNHADATAMAPGELPASGLIEVGWDNAAGTFVLLSPPIALPTPASVAQMEAGASTTTFATPQNFIYSEGAIKGHVFFRWTGSAIVINHKSTTVLSVSRVSTGRYTITLTGGLTFTYGYAIVNGGGATPANAGFIGSGASFTGTNPAFDIRFGDAGGSGGQASDPTDAGVLIFGLTSN